MVFIIGAMFFALLLTFALGISGFGRVLGIGLPSLLMLIAVTVKFISTPRFFESMLFIVGFGLPFIIFYIAILFVLFEIGKAIDEGKEDEQKVEVQEVEAQKAELPDKEEDLFLTPINLEDTAKFLNLTIMLFVFYQLLGFLAGLVLVTIMTLAYLGSLYYLLNNLRFNRPWLYMVGCLIPIIGWFVMLIVTRHASSILRSHGYKIGLMGAKKIHGE